VTGFSGLFEDRAWETVDASFEAARLERVPSAGSDVDSSSPFALPRNASIPVVMLAEGDDVERTADGLTMLFTEPDVEDRLREPATAARLRELMRSRDGGGPGGRIYVSGGADFARRMMAAVDEVLDGQELADLVLEHRYVQVVTAAGASDRCIDASELSLHNDPGRSIWMAIDGRVYDLTAFAEMHPGGQKLIESFAGMDATSTYRAIEHHRDPAVQGLLSPFEIGVLRQPDLDDDAFRRWTWTLNLLVEIENAHRLDTSIGRELPLTPYRLQFAIEAHARFLAQTMAIVGRRIADLARECREPALADEIERVVDEPDAHAARGRCDELELRLAHDGATAALDSLLTQLQVADADYLAAAKKHVAAGLKQFEYDDGRANNDGARLAELQAFPELGRGHLDVLERLVG
jgi:cytochrome b involved in lipid metabolism